MTPPTRPVTSGLVSQGQPLHAFLRKVSSITSHSSIKVRTTPYHPPQNGCSHLAPSWQRANHLPSITKSYKQLAATLVRGPHVVFGKVLTATGGLVTWSRVIRLRNTMDSQPNQEPPTCSHTHTSSTL